MSSNATARAAASTATINSSNNNTAPTTADATAGTTTKRLSQTFRENLLVHSIMSVFGHPRPSTGTGTTSDRVQQPFTNSAASPEQQPPKLTALPSVPPLAIPSRIRRVGSEWEKESEEGEKRRQISEATGSTASGSVSTAATTHVTRQQGLVRGGDEEKGEVVSSVHGTGSLVSENTMQEMFTRSIEGEKERDDGAVATTVGNDNPFAGGVEGGENYMTLTWWRAGMLMIAETISLGILALPSALATLGLIPGTLLLLLFGTLAWYTGSIIGIFRLRHENIHSMADASHLLFGPWGREMTMAGQILFIVFIMGAHILTWGNAVDVLVQGTGNEGRVCAVVYLFGGFVLSFLFTIPRTLNHMSYYAYASFASIIAAVVVTMVGVGIERPGWVVPVLGTGRDAATMAMEKATRMPLVSYVHQHAAGFTAATAPEVRLWPEPDITFHEAFGAVCNIIFAYAGHVAFFSFISELKYPREFPKSLALLQLSDITMYVVTGVVVYLFAGNTVKSPALLSTSPLFRKIAFGVATPTIIIAGVINGHVAVKWIYVRMLRNSETDIMHQKTLLARGIWIAIAFAAWLVAWLIAESVPVFADLVGLTGALFGSWFTFGLQPCFWLFMNFERDGVWKIKRKGGWRWGWKKVGLMLLNMLLVAVAMLIFVAGTYASAMNIRENAGKPGKPFSCSIAY